MTGAAERLTRIVSELNWGRGLTNADGLWLADQLDQSISREAAALATPPGRAAALKAFVAHVRSYVRAEELDSSYAAPAWAQMKQALAELDATDQEAPDAG